MRMHTHGKCTPNILLGALTVFCLIVLYNYWTVSTVNHDLVLKVHSLEERMISMSKSNDALQANLEKVQEIKEKVEGNLKKEQLIDQKAKNEIAQKDEKIKSLQNDLENSKQAAQNCRDEFMASESKVQEKEKVITELKGKVVSLEAQLVENSNKVARVEKELQDAHRKLAEKSVSSSTASGGGGKGAPVPAPAIEEAHHDDQPVLLNDPAVPYPNGWMKPHGSINPLRSVVIKSEADSGVARKVNMGPVILFDNPTKPRAKARFSVLNPPKAEMKPDTFPLKQHASLQKPVQQGHEDVGNNNGGGEDLGPHAGVLQAPGAVDHDHRGDQAGQREPQNLDAAEDDGDRPLKDEFGQQDDQFPDGALPQKEVAAIQAPEEMKQNEDIENQQPRGL